MLGIPAGVKMHSGVFAVSPRAAGTCARRFLADSRRPTAWREVLDTDERWRPVLHGEIRVPADPVRLQGPKQRFRPTGQHLAQLGAALAGELDDDAACLIGPGRTTKSVLSALGLTGTLLGVDILLNHRLAVTDASEQDILHVLTGNQRARLILSPVGGQGFLLGRGNQQLSPAVLKLVGPDNIRVAAPPAKLFALGSRPLLIETSDAGLAACFQPRIRVLVAPQREVIHPLSIELW